MPLTAADVGKTIEPRVQHIDARWIMAYAACLRDFLPCYLDTHDRTVIAHPVFPVAVEWDPIVRQSRQPDFLSALRPEERLRGVHGSHDLHIHRPIRAGDILSTNVKQIGVFASRAGAIQAAKLESRDAYGERVCTTYMQSLYRRVALEGPEESNEFSPPLPDFRFSEVVDLAFQIQVPEGQAHVYTECSRIYSPIHTDRAVAIAAGLPDLILHGTCTLALAVSTLVRHLLDGEPVRVVRVGCRFSAMVRMPSVLTIRVIRRASDRAAFEVINPDGDRAIKDGFLCWR